MLEPLPHNIDAERAILGAMLLNPNCHWLAKGVQFCEWYREAHAWIAQAILEAGVELPAIGQWLQDHGRMEQIGGSAYLTQLVYDVSTSAGIETHIETVKECARRRELIGLCQKIEGLAHHRTSEEMVSSLRAGLGTIETPDKLKIIKASQAVNEAYQEIEEASKHDGTLIGLPTGFYDFDWHTGGLRGGDIIVLGARPGMGKTVFASNVAVRCGKPTLIFNLEMTARQLATRDLAGMGRLDHTKLRTGRLQEKDWERLTKAAGKLSDLPIYYVDSGSLTMDQISVATEKAYKKYGIGLVIVDYLQLICGQGMTKREEFIAYLSRSFKNIAREYNIPVLVLAQLNRQCEQRKNKRPLLSDLRESGSIEQDADVVCFIYREAMYSEKANKKKAELIISKGRNIQIGTIDLVWEGLFQTFQNEHIEV